MFPTADIHLSAGLDARTLRAQGLVPYDALCVYGSGSLVRGWTHAHGDVDVYAVTARPYRCAPSSKPAAPRSRHPGRTGAADILSAEAGVRAGGFGGRGQ